MYRILVTGPAKRDLFETIASWSQHRSSEQAERWFARIFAAINTLRENPERCPVSPEADLLPTGLRELHFGLGRKTTHRIIFTIIDQDGRVLRVRHTARQNLTLDDVS